MRAWQLLLPCVLLSVACSAVPAEEEQGGSTSAVTAGCSLSRTTILGSVSAQRRQALERGFEWLDASVPYSQSARHEGYRTDCSGFVSMCWETAAPGGNTASYVSGADSARLASMDELVAADGLVKSGHMMMFVGWNDDAKTSVCVLEQSSTKNDMQFRTRTVASLASQGYRAIRPDKFAGDTQAGPATNDGLAADPAEEETTDGTKSPDGSTPTTACPTALQACSEAFDLAGVECGTITDRCKKSVNCDLVETFGCTTGTTCSKESRCLPTATATATTPKPETAGAFEGTDDTSAESGADAKNGAETSPGTTPQSADGDDGDSETPATKRSRSDDTPSAASAGCSATPQGSGNALPLLGLVLGAVLVRRRRR